MNKNKNDKNNKIQEKFRSFLISIYIFLFNKFFFFNKNKIVF